ncbi:MAG: patatin-like phospholipase family protein, partial [Clostridia bacterium]|nr:patatin-like phospholipase family protein [Clostridia bacterium]
MKTGVIDVGGGLRGIYAAGILDRLLEAGISFDTAIGISAGSANLASFLAGQKGRTFRFYTEYSQRPEYMGI